MVEQMVYWQVQAETVLQRTETFVRIAAIVCSLATLPMAEKTRAEKGHEQDFLL